MIKCFEGQGLVNNNEHLGTTEKTYLLLQPLATRILHFSLFIAADTILLDIFVFVILIRLPFAFYFPRTKTPF